MTAKPASGSSVLSGLRHAASDRALLERAYQSMHSGLDALRESISRELCAIPPPVPACDVNFNRLLEERGRVVDELQRLARLRAAHAGAAELLSFCRTSTGLDVEIRVAIEALLSRGK